MPKRRVRRLTGWTPKNCCHLTSHGLRQLEASNNYSADGYKLFIMQSSLYLHIVFIIVYAPRIKKSIMIPQDTYHVKIREVSSIAGEPSHLLVISLREKKQKETLLICSQSLGAGCLQIGGCTAAV